jgi:hydrogenase expression/formation protein HypE
MVDTLKAVLFDFDGTLTRPDALDFSALRNALGCPPGTMILEHIDALPTEKERAVKRKILGDFEWAAAQASVPNECAEETVLLLLSRGLRVGILTRNTRASVMESLKNFRTVSRDDFHAIVTRENEGRPKPHPDGVFEAARQLGVTPRELLVVGDFVFDIAAGKAAGASTVLLTNGRTTPHPPVFDGGVPIEAAADYTITALTELAEILRLT